MLFLIVILPLIITTLSIVCLLILGSTKNPGKELIFLSAFIGILVIHSAHDIFLELENRKEDHQRIVDASFTLLYIPFFYIAQHVIFFKGQLSVFAKFMLVLAVLLAVLLYFYVTFRPSMPLYCYANLIWSAVCLPTLMLWQRLLLLSLEYRRKIKYDENFISVHLISIQMMVPFLVQMLCALIPEDNFLRPYQTFLTMKTTIYLVEIVFWILIIINIYKSKKARRQVMQKSIWDFGTFGNHLTPGNR